MRKPSFVKQTFSVGDLLINATTGHPALIVASRDSRRTIYGDGDVPRQLHRLLEQGQQHWKHDVQVAAEYRAVEQPDGL